MLTLSPHRLAKSLTQYQKLDDALKRLQVLNTGVDSVSPGRNLLAHVFSIHGHLSKYSHALSELRDNVIILNQIEPASAGIESILEQISSFAYSTDSLRVRLSYVVDAVSSAPISFFTEGMLDLLSNATSFEINTKCR